MATEQKLELVSAPEIARRSGLCPATALRRLHLAGATPDGVLISGHRHACEVFLASRLPSLISIASRPKKLASA